MGGNKEIVHTKGAFRLVVLSTCPGRQFGTLLEILLQFFAQGG